MDYNLPKYLNLAFKEPAAMLHCIVDKHYAA